MNLRDFFTTKMIEDLKKEEQDILFNFVEQSLNESKKVNLLPIEGEARLDKQGNFYDPLNRKSTRPKNINEFIDLVETLIKIEGEKSTWFKNSKEEIKLVPYGLEEALQTNSISYRILSGEPGPFGKGKVNQPSVSRHNSFLRGVIDDPDDPNYKIYIMSRLQTYMVEFCISSSNSREADELILWLQNILNNYVWYFKYSGIKEFRFTRRGSDYVEEYDSNLLYKRPISYYVLTEELSEISFVKLRKIIMQLNVK